MSGLESVFPFLLSLAFFACLPLVYYLIQAAMSFGYATWDF